MDELSECNIEPSCSPGVIAALSEPDPTGGKTPFSFLFLNKVCMKYNVILLT